MNCGHPTAVTWHGNSYCWSCFDEAQKAQDVQAATKIANGITLDQLLKTYGKFLDGPIVKNIG